jgi:tetratricopeptide (TPR) repeat protein
MAVQAAGQVLEEDPNNVKALYRRAQAYRALDEYESAESDAVRAQGLNPADKGITREIQALHAQRRSAVRDEKTLAVQMLGEGRKSNQRGQNGDTYSAADLAADDEREVLLHWSSPAGNGRIRPTAQNSSGGPQTSNVRVIDCLSVALPLEPVLPTGLIA